MTEAGSPRILWFDAARGLGIILVVFGHVILGYPDHSVARWIYAFHIPLFFFLAGCVEPAGRPLTKVARRCLTWLVLPYLVFGLLSIGVAAMHDGHFDAARIAQRLRELAFGIAVDWADLSFNAPLWFFTCLVALRLLAALLALDPRRPARALGTSLCLAGLAWAAGVLGMPRLPWNIDIAAVALPFFTAGQVMRARYDGRSCTPGYGIVLLIGGSALLAVSVLANTPVSMGLRDYGNPLLFILGAGGGIAATVVLAQALAGQRWLRRIGAASLVIFPTHLLWPQILPGDPLRILSWYSSRLTGSPLLAAASVTVATLLLSWLLYLALRRILAGLIGLWPRRAAA